MELEQRVKTLEYEIKILKNEIQRTLLDIQEQILVHYYPSLRADESTPSEGTIQSLEAIRERKAGLGEAPTPPQVKKVSLEGLRTAQKETPASPKEPSAGSEQKADQPSLLELSGWVSDSVNQIGGQRTSRLIEACAGRKWLTAESKDVLLRLASLGDGDNVPERVAINELLGALLKLNELLGRNGDVEEALTLIEEADLG